MKMLMHAVGVLAMFAFLHVGSLLVRGIPDVTTTLCAVTFMVIILGSGIALRQVAVDSMTL